MRKVLVAGFMGLVALLGLVSGPVQAADRPILGWGRLFTNDFIGDGEDRWRSGSYTVSQVRGQSWDGTLPGFGEILEFRLRSEIIASANLSDPQPDDRRYAGVLGFGVQTHFALARAEASLGAELVVTGDKSGVGRFHSWAHGVIGAPKPGGLDDQISNGIHPALAAELGKTYHFSNNAALRPFVEARAGDETLVRVGADLSFGGFTSGSLMLRDGVTGQRYRAVRGDGAPGMSFLLGGDIAYVAASIYLRSSGVPMLSDSRTRLRAGVHWQAERYELFYGMTYLSKEFETQPEGQVLGSLSVRVKF